MGWDVAKAEAAKAQFFESARTGDGPSSELISSWQRSQDLFGGPGNIRDVPRAPDELLDEQLLDMLRAPLQRFAETLDGTGLGLLLSDANGQVLERWVTDDLAARHFDKVGTFRGAILSEEAVGTNGLGTSLVLNRLVQVRGPEHFADFFSEAICTAAPIIHPISGKTLGSVTFSCDITPRAELLPPLLQSAIVQLQSHVLDLEGPASRHTLDAFLRLSATHTDPVIALGPDGLLMQNALASDLSAEQLQAIRHVCLEVRETGSNGRLVDTEGMRLRVATVAPGNHVAVILDQTSEARASSRPIPRPPSSPAQLVGRTPEWLAVLQQVARSRETTAPLVIAGEPGTGKLTLALGHPWTGEAQSGGSAVVRGADIHVAGIHEWVKAVRTVAESQDQLVIRNAEALDTPAISAVKAFAEDLHGSTRVIVTASTVDRQEAESLGSRIGAENVVWVPPLREHPADLADLWNSFARMVAPGAGMVLSPEALSALRTHSWPGNLAEVRSLVARLARSGKVGPVSLGDLPGHLVSEDTRLSLIEQVEVRAIRQALQESGDNVARAAEILGVSRATVYRKIKAYKLV